MRPATFALFLGICVLASGCRDEAAKICLAVTPPAATLTAPRDLIDLSHWYLTLPVDVNGARSGAAHTVFTSELLAGYSSEWFHGSEGPGVTFFAPVLGATTAHSPYPRSELREVLDPADYSVNWHAGDIAELTAFLAVHRVPLATGKVTVGEIVGYNNDNPDVSVLTKLIYEYNASDCAGIVYASTLPSPTSPSSAATRQVLLRSVPLGEGFPYSIRVENHAITFASGTNSVATPIRSDWDAVGLFYRAGASLFTAGTDAADGASVTFYQLQATH